MGVRRELNSDLEEISGVEVDFKRTFDSSALEWIFRNWFVFTLIIISVALFAGVELLGTGRVRG